MYKLTRYILIVMLFASLVLVRVFQNSLFYDPFIVYFKNDYLYLPFPDYDTLKLLLSIFFRYVVNSVLSIAVIYLLFYKKYLSFSIKFYGIALIILLLLFFIAIQFLNANYLFLFYIRRFLIQPLFILILIPAFYYQNITNKH